MNRPFLLRLPWFLWVGQCVNTPTAVAAADLSSSSWYAGEAYLQVSLPQWDQVRWWLVLGLTAALCLWCLVVPLIGVLGISEQRYELEQQQQQEQQQKKQEQQEGGRRGKRSTTKENEDTPPPVVVYSEWHVALVSFMGLVWTVVVLLGTLSPHQTMLARGSVGVPLFSVEEMFHLVDRIHATAQRRRQLDSNDTEKNDRFLVGVDPVGFDKVPHAPVTTTTTTTSSSSSSSSIEANLGYDCTLNWQSHPFTNDDRQWLTQLLHARLAPTLRRLYSVTVDSIVLHDLTVHAYHRLEDDYKNKKTPGGVQCTAPPERTVDLPRPIRRIRNTTPDGSTTTVEVTGGSHHVTVRTILPQSGENDKDSKIVSPFVEFWNRFQKRPIPHQEEDGGLPAGWTWIHSSRLTYQPLVPKLTSNNNNNNDSSSSMVYVMVAKIELVHELPKTIAMPNDNNRSTGLSALSSWCNVSWLVTWLRQFVVQQHHDYQQPTKLALVAHLLADFLDHGLADTLLPHSVQTLVSPMDASAWQQALDEAYQNQQQQQQQQQETAHQDHDESTQPRNRQATWFTGTEVVGQPQEPQQQQQQQQQEGDVETEPLETATTTIDREEL